jgi:hypothetical protein
LSDKFKGPGLTVDLCAIIPSSREDEKPETKNQQRGKKCASR